MAVRSGGGRECSGLRDCDRFDCVVSSCRDCRDGGPAMRQCFGKGPEVRRPYVRDFVGPTNVVVSEMLSIELQYCTASSIQN